MMLTNAARTAVAAVSRLAEVYDDGDTFLSADAIARDRVVKRPFLGKVLSALTRTGLVTSAAGPGGGFALARPPSRITLADVLQPFERMDEDGVCPFGRGVCGSEDPCPLHARLTRAQAPMKRFYSKTTFETFRKSAKARRPAARRRKP